MVQKPEKKPGVVALDTGEAAMVRFLQLAGKPASPKSELRLQEETLFKRQSGHLSKDTQE